MKIQIIALVKGALELFQMESYTHVPRKEEI